MAFKFNVLPRSYRSGNINKNVPNFGITIDVSINVNWISRGYPADIRLRLFIATRRDALVRRLAQRAPSNPDIGAITSRVCKGDQIRRPRLENAAIRRLFRSLIRHHARAIQTRGTTRSGQARHGRERERASSNFITRIARFKSCPSEEVGL